MSDKEFVTIPVDEYEQLVEDSLFLNCLDSAGVDGWEGYDFAVEEFQEMNNGKDDDE